MRPKSIRLLAALIMAGVLIACDWSEISENQYRSFSDLAAVEEPGNWVPTFMPASAVAIRERHKVDTGAQLLSFGFSPIEALELMRQQCTELRSTDVIFPPANFLGATWWPTDIEGHPAVSESPYEFYRCDSDAYLAIRRSQDQNGRVGYFWRIRFDGA